METIPITPERRAQLDGYAQRHGQDAAAALDEVLATYLAWDEQDYREAVEGIRRGYAERRDRAPPWRDRRSGRPAVSLQSG